LTDKFIIIIENRKISIIVCEDGEYNYLKREGEERQPFEQDSFWQWFREKIDYSGEELSFVVISDDKSFSIPDDIKLSRENKFQKDTQCFERLRRYTKQSNYYPHIKDLEPIPKKRVNKQKKDTKNGYLHKSFTQKTIADIFREETRKYRDAKR